MTPEHDAPTPADLPPTASPRLSSAGAHSAAGGGTPSPSAFSSSLDSSKESDRGDGLHLQPPVYGRPEFDSQSATPLETYFRHSGWARQRQRVWDSLNRTSQSNARLQAFATCGSSLWLEINAAGNDLRCRCNACKDRFCAPCAAARRARMQAAILDAIDGTPVRFVTLTLRHSQTPLIDQIDRLYRSFSALRRRAFWKENVAGGAAFLEVKVGRDQLWHVHLHLLVQGSYLDHRTLSLEWHAVTGDSSIVDVRAVPDQGNVVGYVTKYVTKPASVDVVNDPARLDEMVVAVKGRHLCLTFGTWRKIPLNDPPEPAGEWRSIAALDALIERTRAGDAEALRWITAADRKWPEWKLLDHARPPPADPLPF